MASNVRRPALANHMIFVLLVEDNPGDIFLVERALEQHGIRHVLHVIKDGSEAANFVARIGKPGEVPCPNVILLDLNLPSASGLKILAQVRQHPECADIPVIAVTSSDAPQDRAKMADLGVSRYFRKPSNLEGYMQLGSIISEVVKS
jgi:CheY-like chemotaxis protein